MAQGVTSRLTRDELVRVLGHYDLGRLRTARQAERGFVNENWIVTTDRGRYFLKRRHPDLRQPDVIRAQHDLVRWLRQADFPTPTIHLTLCDETLLILDDECYEIQVYVEGQPYVHGRPAHLAAAALTLGHYHMQVQGFAPHPLRELGELYSSVILETVLTNLIAAWELDWDPGLASIVQQLKAQVVDLTELFAEHGRLPHLVIHGDYYAGNLLFDGDCIVGVVDYDKARWQPRVVELAEALIYFASPRPGHLKHLVYSGFLDWEPFVDFLRNYARAVVLGADEVHVLPDYVRCIWLQMSLTRLLEKGARPPQAREALREVLLLADWGRANAPRMIDLCCDERDR